MDPISLGFEENVLNAKSSANIINSRINVGKTINDDKSFAAEFQFPVHHHSAQE